MARRNVTASFTPATGGTAETVVTLKHRHPFSFDASNVTSVMTSGLFNDNYATQNAQGHCTNAGTNDLFSVQD